MNDQDQPSPDASDASDASDGPHDQTTVADRAGVNHYSDEALAVIVDIHRRLDERYAAVLGREHVADVLADVVASFSSARFTTYVPVLIEKQARERLRAAAAPYEPDS